jgi:peptidoglycan hydrolase-like protein with peptidoglycan-binding domain
MSYHQTIYNLLRGYGLSEAGVLGMLGNWECESGCEPYRVQGDYQSSRAISKAYVNAIETGVSDRERFATDQKGFGLAQWTYPQRKRNLWDAWTKSIFHIDSCELQVWFAIWELQNEYSGLLSFLKTSEAIWDCTDRICREYEHPAVNNVQARYEAALRIRAEIDLSGSAEPIPESSKPEEPKLETWPPRIIDEHCSGWAEVWLLQALLKCHGYNVLVDGIFGESLTHKVKQFQSENGLDPDGAVGNMSWAKLMERR